MNIFLLFSQFLRGKLGILVRGLIVKANRRPANAKCEMHEYLAILLN